MSPFVVHEFFLLFFWVRFRPSQNSCRLCQGLLRFWRCNRNHFYFVSEQPVPAVRSRNVSHIRVGRIISSKFIDTFAEVLWWEMSWRISSFTMKEEEKSMKKENGMNMKWVWEWVPHVSESIVQCPCYPCPHVQRPWNIIVFLFNRTVEFSKKYARTSVMVTWLRLRITFTTTAATIVNGEADKALPLHSECDFLCTQCGRVTVCMWF